MAQMTGAVKPQQPNQLLMATAAAEDVNYWGRRGGPSQAIRVSIIPPPPVNMSTQI